MGDHDLCGAASRGDAAEVERLIAEEGADPNAFDLCPDLTPLQCAAYHGHVAVIDVLLRGGAHVDAINADGGTALTFAAALGQLSCIAALVDAGADLAWMNHSGNTALHTTVAWAKHDCARFLLDAGADTQQRNNHGQRPVDMVSGRRPHAHACHMLAGRARASQPPRVG
jgi:uncharacterized protein